MVTAERAMVAGVMVVTEGEDLVVAERELRTGSTLWRAKEPTGC